MQQVLLPSVPNGGEHLATKTSHCRIRLSEDKELTLGSSRFPLPHPVGEVCHSKPAALAGPFAAGPEPTRTTRFNVPSLCSWRASSDRAINVSGISKCCLLVVSEAFTLVGVKACD